LLTVFHEFNLAERIVYDSSLILGFTTGRILLISEGQLSFSDLIPQNKKLVERRESGERFSLYLQWHRDSVEATQKRTKSPISTPSPHPESGAIRTISAGSGR